MPEIIVKGYEHRMLPVALSPEEHRLRGVELAEHQAALDQVQTERKAALDGFKGQAAEEKSAITRLTPIVENGEEPRKVECELRVTEKGVYQVVRTDTGEVIEKRKATPAELQRSIEDQVK